MMTTDPLYTLHELDDEHVEVLFEGLKLKVKRVWLEPGPYLGCKTGRDRQRRAAEITNLKRREATRARIVAAIEALRATGGPLTVTAIASAASVSRQAIYAYHRGAIHDV